MPMTWLDETAALVALLRSGGRYWSEWATLVEETGSALEVLQEEQSGASAEQLFPTREAPGEDEVEAARNDLVAWRDEGMTIVTVLDETYPANLRTIHDLPPLLFVAGELAPADDRSVAVVGTRQASDTGIELAHSIASGLSERGYTVVSGLAAGIDTAAHGGALDAGGRTIAVIGTGLRHAYPKRNAALQAQLAERSAVVSQFWPDQPPTRTTFPMRNAVMSGLALATVVVEAAGRSGARMQARLALQHGRRVFFPEALVDAHEWAREYAERPGTSVIASPDEIVERLDGAFAPAPLTA